MSQIAVATAGPRLPSVVVDGRFLAITTCEFTSCANSLSSQLASRKEDPPPHASLSPITCTATFLGVFEAMTGHGSANMYTARCFDSPPSRALGLTTALLPGCRYSPTANKAMRLVPMVFVMNK